MKLTGKCKESFERFVIDSYRNFDADYKSISASNLLQMFDRLMPSMQWGVYQDFFDSADFYFDLQPHLGGGQPVYYGMIQYRNEDFIDVTKEIKFDNGELYHGYLSELRKGLIQKANEIYNSNETR